MRDLPGQKLADTIATELARRIVRGILKPDERLRQDHLAKEFMASHVPVREALLKLEAQGLARSLPRRGVRVAPFDPSGIHEVVEMRAALEVLALGHAASELNTGALNIAEKHARACDNATDVETWELENRKFHRSLLTPCKMQRLLAIIDDLHLQSARFLFSSWRDDWERRTDHDHRAILGHLKSGNIRSAKQILNQHLRRVR